MREQYSSRSAKRAYKSCLQDNINTFLPNISVHSVERNSQSLLKVHDTLANLDWITQIHCDSGHHVLPNTASDFNTVLQVLQNEKVFVQTAGREHTQFKKLDVDPFAKSRKKLEGLHKWLNHHKKQAEIEQLTKKINSETFSHTCISQIYHL